MSCFYDINIYYIFAYFNGIRGGLYGYREQFEAFYDVELALRNTKINDLAPLTALPSFEELDLRERMWICPHL